MLWSMLTEYRMTVCAISSYARRFFSAISSAVKACHDDDAAMKGAPQWTSGKLLSSFEG
jgi:hypothetical protein